MRPRIAGAKTEAAAPAEPLRGAAPGPVFAADIARIGGAVQHGEDGGIIDLALVGLRPRWHRRDLDMTDDRVMALESCHQVAALDLDMIEVELHPDIQPAHLSDHPGPLPRPIQ